MGAGVGVMFHFRKTKIRNQKSIHKSVFSPPSEGAAGFTGLPLLSHTTGGGVGGGALTLPPQFSRWTMTALRRLACSSVWLSSDSSLLGKVVMRTNSLAAMAGRAPTTN